MKISFNKPYYSMKCVDYVSEVIYGDSQLVSASFSNRVSQFFENEFSLKNVVLTSSCSSALLSIALTLSEQFQGTIALPSYTFTTTAAVFESVGFEIEYIDVSQDTLCIDVSQLEQIKAKDLVAIVNVNYASYVRNHYDIREWCDKKGVLFIEDAAHGFDSKFDSPAATLSDFATFSFHTTKNITCGEGGAVVINNSEFFDRIMFSLNKGTNRHNFVNGKIDRYEWVSRGSNLILSEIHAAILYANLLDYPLVSNRRREVWHTYYNELNSIFEFYGWSVNPAPRFDESLSNHIFYVIAPNQDERTTLQNQLQQQGVPLQPHYPPLHHSTYGKKFQQKPLPITEHIANLVARFPLHSLLSDREIDYTCDVVTKYFKKRIKI